MRMLLEKMPPLRKLILLQAAAYGLGWALPLMDMDLVLLWDLVLGLTGFVLGIVAIAGLGRDGVSPWRLPVRCGLGLLGSIFGWMVLGLLVSDLLRGIFKSVDTRSWLGLRYMALPVFTTGCLAYFRLPPFRSRARETPSAPSS
jgi:hypothetical protein